MTVRDTEMFVVSFSPEAKVAIADEAIHGAYAKPGVWINRQGARGDVKRSPEGQAEWTIERPYPWRARVVDFTSLDPKHIQVFDGVLVQLIFNSLPREAGVHVSVRNGGLFVEPTDA